MIITLVEKIRIPCLSFSAGLHHPSLISKGQTKWPSFEADDSDDENCPEVNDSMLDLTFDEP